MAEKNRSFDSLDDDDREPDLVAALVQAHQDVRGQFGGPAGNVLLKRSGDRVFVEYHRYDTSLDNRGRLESLCGDVEKLIKDYLKSLKKEVKKRTKKAVKFKELKELGNYSVEKVSLNDRWYLIMWRVYDVTPTAMEEED